MRRQWPSRIEVSIEEHVAVAFWGQATGQLVNSYGEIFPAAISVAPAEAMPVLRHLHDDLGARIWDEAGFVDAFSLSHDWVAESRLAIDQAPIVIGLENHRSGLVWRLVSGRPEVRRGLTALGFTAPWLDARIV